jgi:uncharacterized membrane protein YdjX (TVP38/TMEM64 family)
VLSGRLRVAILAVWALVLLGGAWLYLTRAELLRDDVLVLSAESTLLAATVYFLFGCIRGFTLIPVTYVIPFGLLFLSPTLQLVLTMGGILVSSASIYYFSEHLRLAGYFETHHARHLERLRGWLRRWELPIVIGWSVFPFVPTDLICYVCGALRVDVRKMLAGVLVGEGAICAAYIYLGRHLLSLAF